jgi:chromosome segregation ATPase
MITAGAFLLFVSLSSPADEISQAHTLEKKNIDATVASQQRIDTSSDQAFALKADIEALQAEVDSLTIYRDHLESLVQSQEQEMRSLDEQLDQIDITKRSVVPLMYRMLDGLNTLIEGDKPIRPQVRQQRLEKLDTMMGKANISDAEKYRRILEAYQIELDYGTKLGHFTGSILVDGVTREAEQLYIGRVVLVARSLDQQHFWSWDTQQEHWSPLSAELGPEVNKAFAIANKQALPALLTLPVSLQEGK